MAACLLSAPSFVFAAPCTKTAPLGVPCTPAPGKATEDAKAAIIGFITDAQDMNDDVKKLEATYLAARANPQASTQEKLDACEPYRNAKKTQDNLYKQAIEQTSDLYHVHPAQRGQITIGEPDEQDKKYMTGLSAIWNPQVTDSGPGTKLSVRINGSDGLSHHSGATQMNPFEPNGRQAITTLDGRVFILKDTFELALRKNNLGFLAHILYHETRHFNRLSWTDETGRNRSWATADKEERDAYNADARMGKVFDLKQDEINDLIEKYQAYADAVNSRVQITDDHLTPQQEAVWKNHYEHQQINIEEEYRSLQETVTNERARQVAEQKRAQEERLAWERAEKERKKKSFRVELDAEAASCGYQIKYDADNETMLGFDGPIEAYRLGPNPVPFDFGDLKAVFLMRRVCNEIRFYPHQPAPPACNSAASLLHERVSRGDFTPKLKFLGLVLRAGPSSIDSDECLQAILAGADRITDTKSFNGVIAAYQKRLVKRLAQESKEARERTEEREEREQERNSRGSRSRESDDDSIYSWDPTCNCRVRRH